MNQMKRHRNLPIIVEKGTDINSLRPVWGKCLFNPLETLTALTIQRDISDTIEDNYGFSVSHEMVSDITDAIIKELEEWQIISL